MPQHTRLVTCDQNSKAIPYRWKFINSKETGIQEPSGTDSSHKGQVPMISPIGQVPMIRNKSHKPLVNVWKKSIVCNSPRLQRLLLRLSQYDVNIEYLKGKDNVIADALSNVSTANA